MLTAEQKQALEWELAKPRGQQKHQRASITATYRPLAIALTKACDTKVCAALKGL